jgi:Uncharacterized conserved protein (COG2071)
MFSALQNHPFAVSAFFERSLVLTYALPKEQLQPLIPACLSLDCFEDRWAFVALAMVKTKSLRPKGFPAFMGNDFFLTGYRIFVRYRTSQGKRLRGLYILKSETDKSKMTFFGNLFTHYNYQTTDISYQNEPGRIAVHSAHSGLQIEAAIDDECPPLPIGTPFSDWKEARRFAGPLPFTFTFDAARKEVLLIEGVRKHWVPKPVTIMKADSTFMRQPAFQNAVLASAFLIQDIPYYWKKGRVDAWRPE